MRKIFNLFAFLFLVSSLSAQAPDTLWTRVFGDTTEDFLSSSGSLIETPDGGYMVVGSSGHRDPFLPDPANIYVVKTNRDGNLLWDTLYGGSSWEDGFAITRAVDGGYIIGGTTDTLQPDDNEDVWLFKIDSLGSTVWSKIYGGPSYELPFYIIQTSDSGYAVSGRSWGNILRVYVLRTDKNGDTLWTTTIERNNAQEGNAIVETPDLGFIIAGWTGTIFDADIYIVKIDRSGDVVWERFLGNSGGNDAARSIQKTFDGNYIVVGMKEIAWPNVDVWLIKINDNGDTLWTRRYGGPNFENAWDVKQTPDSGFVIAGLTKSYGNGAQDFYIIKTDKNGDTLWTKTVGGSSFDVAYSIQLTSDSAYIIAGRTSSFGSGGEDFYLVKLRSYVEIEEKFSFIRNRQKNTLILPQGSFFRDRITLDIAYPAVSWRGDDIPLKIVLYNVSGVPVFESFLNHTATVTIEDEKLQKLPSGIYFLSVSSKEYSKKFKILKLEK